MTVPQTLDTAIIQAIAATERALDAGCLRVQIELAIPEIALQAQSLALQFTPLFESYGLGLRVLFPDTGAASLARRDWGETWFQISDLGSRYTPIEMKIADTDQAYLVVSPSAVEVQIVEQLCELAGDRPVVLLIPQLEDVSIVGIGYAARKLRERFLSTLISSYYFRPLDGAVVLRSFPSQWQVYLEEENDSYRLIAEEPQKPMGDDLEQLILKATIPAGSEPAGSNPAKKSGLFASMGRFLRALNQ